jgi:hypothetical protein
MKKYIVILLFTMSFTQTSCDSSSDPSTSSNEEIFPLKIGNKFVYLVEHFDYNTGNLDSTQINTVEVTSSQKVNTDTYYTLMTKSSTGRIDSVYAANRTDGLWFLSDSESELFVKYPANIGDSWGGDSITGPGPVTYAKGKWILKAKDEPVSVPAGIFNCYRYQLDLIDSNNVVEKSEIRWMSPSKGIIKIEQSYNHLVWRSSLQSLSLK